MLKLTRPLCVLDIEATGLEITRDRIVTLAIIKLHPDGKQTPYAFMCNPGFTMSPEVIAIHGITDDMVADSPSFSDLGANVRSVLDGCDLAGFNLTGFDLPLLWEEFHRSGIEWDLTDVAIVDASAIFRKLEPRDLTSALSFYCGMEHSEAHNAMGDVMATIDVLKKQLAGDKDDAVRLIDASQYKPLSSMTVKELSDFCAMEKDGSRRLDLAGTIMLNKDGVPVFGTKRNRGVPVEHDMGYAEWMIYKADFPTQTKHVIRRVLDVIDARTNKAQGEDELF
jgi:DNA polymerase III subunit epsilon